MALTTRNQEHEDYFNEACRRKPNTVKKPGKDPIDVMLYRITDETGLQLDVNALAAVLVELMDRKADA